MYLKALEIHGFKSFANKITFQFHNGITGIVGPNGSGKSNVGDAVRWVLGEQSAKQLRGSNMQDIIFAGTQNRKPMGYAYVAITLDNADHKLPVDYEEVTVARRVYRSGESEYLINGTTCRLKDVHELFFDTGIGKEGYSIIGQGQIDKILSGKPEERRELFDEAAGIVKFKYRKQTAQRKLDDEKQNLVRITDILTELEKQIGPLERQSKAAKEYVKLFGELKIQDANLFLLEMERIKQEVQELTEKISIAEHDLEDAGQEYERAKIAYDETNTQLDACMARIDEISRNMNEAEVHCGKLEGQIRVLQEQIHSVEMSEEHYKNREAEIKASIEERNRQKATLAEEKQSIQEKVNGASEVRGELNSRLKALQEEKESLNNQIEQGKNTIIASLNDAASEKSKLSRYDTILEQNQIRRAELNQKLLSAKSEEAEQDAIIEKLSKNLEETISVIDGVEVQIHEKEEKGNELRRKMEECSKQTAALSEAYHRDKSKLDSLVNLTERYDGYGNSIRRVMEQKDKHPGIIGVVADIIKTDKQYETAIETALGGSIQNIVTEDENTAKQMIAFLKQNKAGRATFLPLTSIRGSQTFQRQEVLKEQGVIGLADSLVQTEEAYRAVAVNLLGRTVVADTIDNAIALARKYKYSLRIVTLEGESLSPGGSMTGGSFKNNSNLLGRRREIEELETAVKNHAASHAEWKKQGQECTEQLAGISKELEVLKKELQQKQIAKSTAEVQIKQANARKEDSINGTSDLRREVFQIENQVQQIKAEKSEILMQIQAAEENRSTTEEKITASREILEQVSQQIESLTKEAAESELSFSESQQKIQFIRENEKRIEAEIRQFEQELEKLADNRVNQKDEICKKEEEIQVITGQIAEGRQRAAALREESEQAGKDKEVIVAKQKEYVSLREQMTEKTAGLDKELYRLRSRKEKSEEESDRKINYMWESYELTYSTAEDLRSDAFTDSTVLKTQIGELKAAIKKLGNVNPDSIEEYQEVSERYEFLKAQHEDLVESEKALAEIIAELDSGMRKQFEEKFLEIKVEFDKTFKALFGGGQGTLELSDSEDILEAGIRIIAQPPGKKLQNMMQLSGGEKALTAIALLFAIQNLKPSPFCLLDEIEAALDEANVDKFAKYLHKLTKHTQFIIITHRRGTMAVTDRLYGITMQEKGISTLVSVNLIEDELDA